MCIAIYKPRNVEVDQATLAQCFKSNPDGAGFMYAEQGRLTINKGYFSFDEFWEAFQPHANKHAAIHFRIKTHGAVDEVNCHPFRVNNTLGFIHNGIISGHGSKEHSDTYMFNEEIIKPMMKRFGKNVIHDDTIRNLIEKYIGYSKLVFLNNYGDYTIFNESSGHWHNGAWFSNSSYKPPVPKVEPKTPQIYRGGYPYDDIKEYPRQRPKQSVQEWYLPKADGTQIWKDDWILTTWSYNEVPAKSLATVTYIYENGNVDLKLLDGSIIRSFPGCYVSLYDWENDKNMSSFYEEAIL